MILGSKVRYAVMAMADLAMESHGAPVTLAAIAERQEIPLNYLEQIFLKLRKSGLVRSVRGPGGGYLLARESSDIWISDIVIAVEETFKMTRCAHATPSGCIKATGRCVTHDLWEGLENQIYSYLRAITLDDLTAKRVAKLPSFLGSRMEAGAA